MYLIGFWIVLTGLLYIKKIGYQRLSRNDILDYLLWGWFGLIVGARLGYAVFYNWDLFMQHPDYFYKIWMGGMSFHGAMLGITLATYICAVYKKQNLLDFTDILMIPVPLALALGRVGNFINGELWGRPGDVPWAVIFPYKDNLPRHPSQLYQALSEGLLLFVILWALRKYRHTPGILSAGFLVFYGISRFIVEFFREPDQQVGFVFGMLSMGQVLCLAMIAAGIVLAYWAQVKEKNHLGAGTIAHGDEGAGIK